MRENNKYLLFKLWIPASLIISFGIFSVLASVYQQDYGTALIAVVLPLAASFIIKKRVSKKAENTLQQDTPEEMIKFYRESLKPNKIPNGDALLTNNIAQAYVLYGQYDRAIKELEQINWASRPPVIQAQEILTKALINYLKQDNIAEGLTLARKARDLADVSGNFPGVKQSREAFDTYIQIGQILMGYCPSGTIPDLERKFHTDKLILKLFIAWGLAHAYKNEGKPEKAEAIVDFCKEKAPYCWPLHMVG